MDTNRGLYDRLADSYSDALALLPAERSVLTCLGPTLAETDMLDLDLGLGAGRTGYTFAPLVRRYVGVDYSPRMLERAQELLGDDPNVDLLLGDARDLSILSGPFDFVLFSFNGIDAAAPEERPRILREIRRVIGPKGRLLLSSHSLNALPLDMGSRRTSRRRRSWAHRAYAAFDDLRLRRRLIRINRALDLDEARRLGWTVVEGGGQAGVVECYVDPEFQVRQLHDAGFEPVAIFGGDGKRVELPYGGRDPWLDYLCKPLG